MSGNLENTIPSLSSALENFFEDWRDFGYTLAILLAISEKYGTFYFF